MKKLSTGQDSTLGVYRSLIMALLGTDSPAVAFLDRKIAENPNGADEEVVADEGQTLYALYQIHATES